MVETYYIDVQKPDTTRKETMCLNFWQTVWPAESQQSKVDSKLAFDLGLLCCSRIPVVVVRRTPAVFEVINHDTDFFVNNATIANIDENSRRVDHFQPLRLGYGFWIMIAAIFCQSLCI